LDVVVAAAQDPPAGGVRTIDGFSKVLHKRFNHDIPAVARVLTADRALVSISELCAHGQVPILPKESSEPDIPPRSALPLL